MGDGFCGGGRKAVLSGRGLLWLSGRADGAVGPAVKILSHDNYTFYNPSLHPEFTAENSPVLIFEGTYSAEAPPTARR